MALDIHRTVEDAKNFYSFLGLHEIRDSIMAVQHFPDFAVDNRFVALPQPRVLSKKLDLIIDSLNNAIRGPWTICGDIAMNLF